MCESLKSVTLVSLKSEYAKRSQLPKRQVRETFTFSSRSRRVLAAFLPPAPKEADEIQNEPKTVLNDFQTPSSAFVPIVALPFPLGMQRWRPKCKTKPTWGTGHVEPRRSVAGGVFR
jgi:hypothetical protein